MVNLPENISEENLQFLFSLFISNVPQHVKDEWRINFVRIFAELEYAHWYYLDNFLKSDTNVGIDFFGFCQQMFDRFPHLIPKKIKWKDKFGEWKYYRGATCTGSAIILDESLSMVLLVRGFNNDRWTFPGGKVNQGETLRQCAIREVMEETGLDIEHRIDDSLYLETNLVETRRRAYIVEGFPRINRLQPSTVNEIEAIMWFSLAYLPCSLQDDTPIRKMNLKPNIFYCIIPFIKQLREYVNLRNQNASSTVALSRSINFKQQQISGGTIPLSTSSECKAPLPKDSTFKTESKDKQHPLVTKQPKKKCARSARPSSSVGTDSAVGLKRPTITLQPKPPHCATPRALKSPDQQAAVIVPVPFVYVNGDLDSESIWGGQVTFNTEAFINASIGKI